MSSGPDLKKFLDKNVSVKLNGRRSVTGVLRGYDQFMNLVLEDTYEEISATERKNIGMTIVRGNSVLLLEPQERL
eukprot:CAMPEP_0119123176 /NCGR_PEP_ID=MMETSP1310-20130426/3202_1 /TAXON_ID=464262 /ORGANISM="Genus nov. species nov., Strain RCC2339" /LENGTH=74 /DNA_ID=CAMNT_0007112939 /DNA_START=114 /DNA_END=338 /DNA_ORIENTATION=+